MNKGNPEELMKVINNMEDKQRNELADAIVSILKEKCGIDGYCHCDCGLHKENGDY